MKVNAIQTPKRIKFSELTIGDIFVVADRISIPCHDYLIKTPVAMVGSLKSNCILLELGAHSYVDDDSIVIPLNAELKIYDRGERC